VKNVITIYPEIILLAPKYLEKVLSIQVIPGFLDPHSINNTNAI